MNRLYVLAFGTVAALGCKKELVAAHVDCEVKAGPVIDCTTAQTKGKSEVEVCWDFKVTCANAATLEATHTCAHVKDGQSSTTTIPTDKIKLSGSCEGDKNAAIANLTIDGTKAEQE